MIERIARQRLTNLHLSSPFPGGIVDLVEEFGAVQAQDYAAAKWALGLRVRGIREADVDRAFDDGRLLRTHVMRPTWQFVTPSVIGWLLDLTAARVNRACAFWNRHVGLDAAVRRRTQRTIRKALGNERHLTRQELGAALKRDGVEASGVRLAAIVLAAELDAVVCSGPRRGKQFTYALFEDRVPAARSRSRDRAVEDLARRYFATHGPATARDFSWWSGLAVATAREAVEMLGTSLVSERVGAHTYWRRSNGAVRAGRRAAVHLLPAFDEFVVGYRDRAAVPYRWPGRERAFLGSIFAGADLVGSWRRAAGANGGPIETIMRRALTAPEVAALRGAARRYAAFVRPTAPPASIDTPPTPS